MISGPNLAFSSKLRVSVMCGKFQMIVMHYGDMSNEQRYHREGPWTLYKWNLGGTGKALRCALGNPNWVFSTTKTDSVICAKFQAISWEFSNFQKISHKKESGKMFEPQVNSKDLSLVYHQWPKLTFFIKTQCIGDVWKVSNDFDALWWYVKWTKIPQRKPLKPI